MDEEHQSGGVFADIFPAEWAADGEFCEYLAELSAYSLESLKKEPTRLAEERESNLTQTQDLAFKNYKTFIQTADCTRDVFSEFGQVETKLDSLLDALPGAIDNCAAFHQKASQISQERKMNNLTKTRYTELLELLEVAQLMDTTVRNSYFDEALELIEFARKLEKKFISIPVIEDIVDAVKKSSHLLLNHLLDQLKTNIQLPSCLRYIGYLRRMNCFSEAELRIKFLESRDHWLQTNLAAIPTAEPHQHIMKTIEACRVHMFDIITQYKAIFSDEDTLSSETSEAILFHSWVQKKIQQFLAILKGDLQHQSCAAHMESIMAQSMYFGLSFSRVGADFRPLLVPIFLASIESYFVTQIDRSEDEFKHNMKSFHLSDSISLFSSPIQSAIGVSLQPPPSLLEYPPFAVLANGLQAAFASLRSCCPLSLGPRVKARLENTSELMMGEITRLHRNEASSFTPRERDSFVKLCSTIVNELLPFVNTCLSHLFPQASLAESLGMTLRASHQICQLNLDQLTEPLQLYIPREEEEEIEEEVKEPIQTEAETKQTSDEMVDEEAIEPMPTEAESQPTSETPTEPLVEVPVEAPVEPPAEPKMEQDVEPVDEPPKIEPKTQNQKRKQKRNKK